MKSANQLSLLFILTAGSFALTCIYTNQENPSFKSIRDARVTIFGEKSRDYLWVLKKLKDTNYVDPALKNICFKDSETKTTNLNRPAFLGAGSFGAVFQAGPTEAPFAVKMLSFYAQAHEKIEYYYNSMEKTHTMYETCQNDMLCYLEDRSDLVSESSTPLEVSLEKTNLKKLLDNGKFENCGSKLEEQKETLLGGFKAKLNAEISEIELNQRLSDYSRIMRTQSIEHSNVTTSVS